MGKKKIDVYRTGIYLRLSQGDEDIDGWEKQESNSISNQRLLLEGFIDAHDDLKLVDVFIDDGYTGSNFDRPEFQRMMKSMKAGKLDRMALVSFVDRILIYDDFRVEIVFKYRQEMEKVAGLFYMANEEFIEPDYTMADGLPVLELKEAV